MDHFVPGEPVRTDDLTGHFYRGIGPGPRPGVVVIHGGGGAGGYERGYAARLAEHGYTVLCADYFDAPGRPDGLAEIPLEYFADAADWLLDRPDVTGDRVGVVGFSRGGEAALLVGSHFEQVGAVVAYVPSCYAFPAPTWMEAVEEECATWTLSSDPLDYVPINDYGDEEFEGIDEALGRDAPDPTSRAIELTSEDRLERAAIPVERIEGPVLLVSGGDDAVWPSSTLAARAADRLAASDHPWPVEHRDYPEAGHAIRVPYRFDGDDDPDEEHWLGGTNETNARASADAWHHALQFLRTGIGE